VEVGLTLLEPFAEVDVKVPGVMAIDVAPLVAQLSVLLDPVLIVVGLALKELMVGLPVAFTVTVRVDVVEPVELPAVRVYVVVDVGLTLVEPLADVDVYVPGVMAIVAAPLVAQLRVLLAPELIPVGLAANELIAGFAPGSDDMLDEPQPGNPAETDRTRIRPKRLSLEKSPEQCLRLFLPYEFVTSMPAP